MSAEWWGADVVPRVRWFVRLREGDELPDGYGIAYYEPNTTFAVCMPLPLNVIVGGWRAFIWWLKCPPWRLVEWKADNTRRRIEEARYAGFHEARRRFDRETTMLRAQNESLIKVIVEADLTAPRIIPVSREMFEQITKGHVS